MSEITTLTQTLRDAISARIYGKEDVIEKVLAALYCGGHVLLNDIPGTGKTTLARTLAGALVHCNSVCSFQRQPCQIISAAVHSKKDSDCCVPEKRCRRLHR